MFGFTASAPRSRHRAGDLQGVLATQMLCLVEVLLGHAIGVDDHLGVAGAIAQVAEDQPAVIAVVPRPTAQRDLAAHVGLAQLAARCVVHAKLVDVIRHSLLLLAMLYGRPAANAGPGCCSNLAIVHHERSWKPHRLPAPLKMPWLQRRGGGFQRPTNRVRAPPSPVHVAARRFRVIPRRRTRPRYWRARLRKARRRTGPAAFWPDRSSPGAR